MVPNTVSFISRRAIREWAETHGYSSDADFMGELYEVISALDRVWVADQVKKAKARAAEKGNKGGNSP